ncbi:MAG: type II toxin-antitoxin system Phd/YefM family antitoxin [Candidatus Omnitrophica bacterium]|nr:type II toxin-antitoxin system Phd/YefM family antitoxin [Candidatus Omnitrophota bacterium]
MTTLSVTQAKNRFLKMVRDTDKRLAHFLITKQGKPVAVMLNVDEYEGWLETLELLSNKKAAGEIRKALNEIRQGKYHTFEEVVGRPQRKS